MAVPIVTIAIPTYNRCRLLEQALKSAIAQDYPQTEILVSDNASTDDTPGVIEKHADPRLRALQQETAIDGIANFNACLAAARGEWILFLSDDDLLMPRAISRLVEATRLGKRVRIAYGQCRIEAMDGQLCQITAVTPETLETGTKHVRAWLAGRREVAFCATLYHASTLRRIGGMPAFAAGDSAVRAVIAVSSDVAHVPEVVATYRLNVGHGSHAYPMERWLAEDEKLLKYLHDRLPAGWATRGDGLARRYLAKCAGSRLGTNLQRGASLGGALRDMRRVANQYGWRNVLGWNWTSILLKTAISEGHLGAVRRMLHL